MDEVHPPGISYASLPTQIYLEINPIVASSLAPTLQRASRGIRHSPHRAYDTGALRAGNPVQRPRWGDVCPLVLVELKGVASCS